ncbi:MFS transporter [Burkholderia diffusa]|uniref:MFS transporter n=1 Tax=Burkholderia diffusa TaxID=488732 RepID=UPI002ABDFF1E|nr:MFS transporter [Burkholderia diffusa]
MTAVTDSDEYTASRPGRGTLALLAAACGITVGNVYLCQPLLDQIAIGMGVPASAAGLVAVSAQVGYALGILFVIPLADTIAAQRLLRILLLLTALSLLAASLSPTISMLIGASVALTATTVIPQILIPVVSGYAAPAHRGRIVGSLQTGLILGILLSRTLAGGVAQASGSWRSPYLLAAALTGCLIFIVPRPIRDQPDRPGHTGYLDLLRSLPPLLRHRPLRLSMALGFLVFAAFSAFWATLAFHLASPAFRLGPATAGLFGLYGAPGALLAPVAGRLSDRLGTFRVNLLSLVTVAAALLLAGLVGAFSVVALVVAVNLLDFGLQTGQIANQTRIFALGNDIRARVNTLYMAATFSGGAVGSLIGAVAWTAAGWHGVCALAVSLAIAASLALALSK